MRNRIKEWRDLRGMNQADLAERIGEKTHTTTISRLENGHMSLTLDWMLKIAKALECHPGDLIGDTGDEPPQNALEFQEEATLFTPHKGHWLETVSLKQNQYMYSIKSNAIDAKNVKRNSIVIADFSADTIDEYTTNRDTFLSLVKYHYDSSNYERVVIMPRQYVSPNIAIRNSSDKTIAPIYVDSVIAELAGVIVTVLRDT